MKSYREFCSVAKALDVIGDRWALLVVRELLLGPRRYTDLLEGLPGVGTNVLSTRLRELERAGVVIRRRLLPPTAVTVYELTRRRPRPSYRHQCARPMGLPPPHYTRTRRHRRATVVRYLARRHRRRLQPRRRFRLPTSPRRRDVHPRSPRRPGHRPPRPPRPPDGNRDGHAARLLRRQQGQQTRGTSSHDRR